jgi:phospholipid/cholesterol/gamma-HCH transport system permease protein
MRSQSTDNSAKAGLVPKGASVASLPIWHLDIEGAEGLLRLGGDWLVRKTGVRSAGDLDVLVRSAGRCNRVRFDTSQLGAWDSALVVFIRQFADLTKKASRSIDLDLSGLPEPLQRLLALARADLWIAPAQSSAVKRSVTERIGLGTIAAIAKLEAAAELVGDTVLTVRPLFNKQLHARGADIVLLIRENGAGALGIVATVSGLVGAILAFIGAVQFRRFGAEIYVANLVGVAVVREMAAVMTGIVMAGRTGGAYAAQIATMQGNEELDALQALGVPFREYIVLPRVAALVTMMPLLYLYGCFIGLSGGMAVSVLMLKLSPTLFLEQLRPAVALKEFSIGFTKSIVFGAYVALAGCRIGLNAGRSASDVGNAATEAVVAGIIGIIAMDAVFAACTNVLGI